MIDIICNGKILTSVFNRFSLQDHVMQALFDGKLCGDGILHYKNKRVIRSFKSYLPPAVQAATQFEICATVFNILSDIFRGQAMIRAGIKLPVSADGKAFRKPDIAIFDLRGNILCAINIVKWTGVKPAKKRFKSFEALKIPLYQLSGPGLFDKELTQVVDIIRGLLKGETPSQSK